MYKQLATLTLGDNDMTEHDGGLLLSNGHHQLAGVLGAGHWQ